MTDVSTVERLLGEDRVSLAEAGRLVATNPARPVDPTTVGRWCQRGILLPDGQRVKLEHLKVGQRFCTTRQALARFIARQTAADAADGQAPAVRSPAARTRASEKAAAELAALGV